MMIKHRRLHARMAKTACQAAAAVVGGDDDLRFMRAR
jgi:hypothetical protein